VGGSGFFGHEITRQARLTGEQVVATFHSHALPIAGVEWRTLDITRLDPP
jgi:dTDP-4-dehydrorhamnose reductase